MNCGVCGDFLTLGIHTDTTTYAKEVIEGTVVVTRSPCLHPGDVRALKAVNKSELSHLENVIVFSQKGDRPVPDKMSGILK